MHIDDHGPCSIKATTGIKFSVPRIVPVNVKEEAVWAFVKSKDVFGILPIGYDKSVIYAILPLLFDFSFLKFLCNVSKYVVYVNEGRTGSIVVVITPLIALIVDQKKSFHLLKSR